MNRLLLLAAMTIGVAVVWLAIDPPAPHEAAANAFGPPVAKTAAPGEGECTDCHTGHAVNPDTLGSVTITGVPSPYMPNQTYPLTVTVARPGQIRWGFELTVLRSLNSTFAGTLANTTTLTRVVSFNGRSYMEQTTINGDDGTFSNQPSGVWTFNWTSPAAGAGTVIFYAAGNAADGNGSSVGSPGDLIYTTAVSSAEGSATAVDATTWGRIKMLYR